MDLTDPIVARTHNQCNHIIIKNKNTQIKKLRVIQYTMLDFLLISAFVDSERVVLKVGTRWNSIWIELEDRFGRTPRRGGNVSGERSTRSKADSRSLIRDARRTRARCSLRRDATTA